jgi:hypothetical protein
MQTTIQKIIGIGERLAVGAMSMPKKISKIVLVAVGANQAVIFGFAEENKSFLVM